MTQYLTIREAAKILDLPPNVVRHWVPCVKRSNPSEHRRFDASVVGELAARRPLVVKPQPTRIELSTDQIGEIAKQVFEMLAEYERHRISEVAAHHRYVFGKGENE